MHLPPSWPFLHVCCWLRIWRGDWIGLALKGSEPLELINTGRSFSSPSLKRWGKVLGRQSEWLYRLGTGPGLEFRFFESPVCSNSLSFFHLLPPSTNRSKLNSLVVFLYCCLFENKKIKDPCSQVILYITTFKMTLGTWKPLMRTNCC